MTQPIRRLRLVGDAEARGRAHGSAYAAEIREYTADRVARSATGTDLGREDVFRLAEACLPAHAAYDADLYAEMVAMADAAGITPAEAVIVGGYTDFIDLVAAVAGSSDAEDTCTAVIVPDDAAADGHGFLAQTWDMHASATPHIVMLDIRPPDSPATLVFSTVGCIGQIGMNDAGIAIGINNLTGSDGRVGVTWPFVVRKALKQRNIDDALACILDAELAGAHNYLLFDADGNGYDVEAMPTGADVTKLEGEPLVHTNHCLTPVGQAREGWRHPQLAASSEARLRHAAELLARRPVTVDDLIDLTRDERAICRHPDPPFDYETCGAAIMRPATGDFWAVWGVPAENEYEHFALERHDG